MPEKIEPTWIAYALAAPTPPDAINAAIDRIQRHYEDLVDYPNSQHACLGDRRGIAVIADAEPQCRWPHFSTGADLSIATAYVPTDWQRLIGERSPTTAPLPLARSIRAAPARAIEALSAPFVAAVLDRSSDELIIINDCIGAGRCYELVFEGGCAWSNRVGALPLFAGLEAQADLQGWLNLAAATWFIGNSTAMAGVTRVPPGSVGRANDQALSREQTQAVSNLVAPAGLALDEAADAASIQMRAQAATAGQLWPRATQVDLSGGRDSRLAAAAAIAAKLDARFHTSDKTPGEAAVARELVARAPQPLEHRIRHTGDGDSTPSAPLLERALRLHLLHDGMRHPQKLRGNLKLPRSRPSGATLSGHGGEIAHGFFYKSRGVLKQLSRGGDQALVSRLARFFTKRHRAAKAEAYELAQTEIERTISQGLCIGLEGPELLDWFYLMDRFAYRSGLASHAERVSVFATPAFIRAAFALTPEQRLDAVLHRELVSRLVPAWQDVPFFKAEGNRIPSIRRRRLWEHAPDAAAVERILSDAGPWTEIYDPDRVRQAWSKVQAGGSANWESIFEGVVYRVAYEDYLRSLNEHSRQGPRLMDAVGAAAPPG